MNYRWLVFWIVALQYLFVYFHRVCPAVVAPELMKTFQIGGTSLGVLASGYFYSYAIMQIPVGLLSDSWGPRKTIALLSLAAAAGAFLFALAPGFGMATAARIIVGFGVSATFVASLKLLASWFKSDEYARISGLFMAVGGMGWLSAATPLALMTQAFGWRASFVITGVVTAALTILTWFFVVDRPQTTESPDHKDPPEPGRAPLLAGFKAIFTERGFWANAWWLFLTQGSLFSFFGLWAGPYLMDTYGLSKPTAGNVLSMVAVGMIVGGPFLGHLSDRILRSRKKVLVGASVVNLSVWAFAVLSYASLSSAARYGMFLVMGVTTSVIIIIVMANVKELFPTRIAGTAMGAANLFSFFGGVVQQPFMGFVLDSVGRLPGGAYPPQAYRAILLVYLAMSAVSLILSCFTRETLRHA